MQTIQANTAFDRLQKMREDSPTGGALGQVTEKELDLLKSSVANINPNQSQEAFFSNLATSKQAYLARLAEIDPEAAAAYREKKGIRWEREGGPAILVTYDGPIRTDKRDNPFGIDLGGTPPSGGGDSFFRMPKDANEFWQGIKAGTGDIVQGAGDTLGIVGNPLNATVNAITGLNLSTDLGKALVDITGLPTSKGAVNTINRAATSGLMFGGGAATLGARALPGVARNALLQVGANPVGDAIVGGAAAGSGEAVKAAGGGEAAQAGAMLVGGLAGAGAVSRLGRNAPAIVRGGPGGGGGMPRAVQPTTEGGEVIAAADRLNTRLGTNIEPMPADVGGPFIRRATGGGAQFPLAASPIISQAKTVSTETQAARDAIARIAGNAVDPENAGEAALSGATKYMQKSKTKVDALYAKARRMGGDELVDLPNARTVLDRNIAELAQTPGGATGLARMKSLRAELDQPYPVEGIKRMRTSLRDEFISDGLRGSDVERRMKQVIDAADEDIAEGLAAAGKADAADAYREAAKAHRERVETIDEVLAPFIGRDGDRSGEQVFQAIVNSTAKNNKGLAAFMKAIPAEDAATVRASIIGSLGKSSAGRQDAEGMAFSAGEFLTHWNKLSPGAKSTLFGGELRAALDDLAKVAGGSKEAQKYANFSNTGSVLGITATGGSGAAAYAEPVTGGALLALQYVTGKMLASPKIARLIAKMPKDPRKARAHIQGLRKIAGAERAIAPQVNYLFDQIANDLMVTGGPARLAAEPDGARGPERSAKPTTMPVPK